MSTAPAAAAAAPAVTETPAAERANPSAAGRRRTAVVLDLPPGPMLPPETQDWITEGLAATLPGLRMRELFRLRRPEMLTAADHVIVALDRSHDQVVGLLTSRWTTLADGRECLHVMVQFVGEQYRHGAVFLQSWATHFDRLLASGRRFPALIALKTYNPVVHCAMGAFSRLPEVRMYPPIGSTPTADDEDLATAVSAALAPGTPFDPRTGVLSGIGRPIDLYRQRPMSSDQPTNEYFARHTVPGDRILCVLAVPTEAGRDAILGALGVRPAAPWRPGADRDPSETGTRGHRGTVSP